MLENLIAIVKKNWIISVIVVIALTAIIFPRQVKRMFNPTRRKRRRRVLISGRTRPRAGARRGRFIPRSVGTRKVRTSGKGYPAAAGGYIPFKYNKDGSVKKAWQVGGTVAARNRMRGLRRKK